MGKKNKNKKKDEDLTPVERAKKLKEEAEKKAREEEESRLLAEKEELERKEKERLEKERKEKLNKQEKTKLRTQLPELENLLVMNHNHLVAEEIINSESFHWQKYKDCSLSPNPANLRQINTYLSLLKEDQKCNYIEAILNESNLILSLISELKTLIYNSKSYHPNPAHLEEHKKTLSELESILEEKLDAASHNIMASSSRLAAPDTDYSVSYNNNNIYLCIYVNLSKNPRIKSTSFEDLGVVVEVNSYLNKLDCSIRVFVTKYDHISKKCPTYLPCIKHLETTVKESSLSSVDDKGTASFPSSVAINKIEVIEKSPSAQGKVSPIIKEEALTDDDDDEIEKTDANKDLVVKEVYKEPEEFDEKKYGLAHPVMVEYTTYDVDKNVYNMRCFETIGGCFSIDLLATPPQPKVVKNWTVTLMLEPPTVVPIDYRGESLKEDVNQAENNVNAEGVDETEEDVEDKKLQEAQTPVSVNMKLPDVVLIGSQPQLGRFDPVNNVWRRDGFDNISYNAETRQLNFRMLQFGTMALMADSFAHLPFKYWSCQPDETGNKCVLTFLTQHLEVEIMVQDSLACLKKPELKELSILLNKFMTVPQLIQEMKFVGLNLFPAPDANQYIKSSEINLLAEDRFYKQVGLVGSVMAFASSKWNCPVSMPDMIVVKYSFSNENPVINWKLLLFNERRVCALKMEEDSVDFSDHLTPNIELETNVYHLAMKNISEESRNNLNSTTAEFSDAVYLLLKRTRVLAYSN